MKKILVILGLLILMTTSVYALETTSTLLTLEYKQSGSLFTGVNSFDFDLYYANAGGTSAWTDSQAVTFVDGKATIALEDISGVDWSRDVYFAATPNGGSEMSPRLLLRMAPDAIANPFDYNITGGQVSLKNSTAHVILYTLNVSESIYINGSQVCTGSNGVCSGSGNVSSVSGDDIYTYNSGSSSVVVIGFNETKLNSTILTIANANDNTNDDVSSSEFDNLCSTNGRIVRRTGGTWACFDDSVYYDDTTLSEAQVDAYVSNNGYITTYTVTEGDVTAHEGALTITESQISDLTHTVDTNETTRFNNLVATACSSGNFVRDIYTNGTVVCDAPAGSGDVTAVYTNGDYLDGGAASGDISITVNEANLNATIISITDARDSDTTYSVLSEFTNDVGYFDNIANFTGTLTSGKWCIYDGTEIDCNVDPVVDTDTTYTHLSNFTDDIGATSHYTDSDIDGTESAFTGWDKDASDDFDGAYSSLTGVPDLTQYNNTYTHLSNFTDDIGVSADYDSLSDLQTAVTNDFHNLGGTDDDNPEAGDVFWTDLTDEGTFTNGYVCTFTAPDTINCNTNSSIYLDNTDAQTGSFNGTHITLTGGNTFDISSVDTDTQLDESEVDTYVANNGYGNATIDSYGTPFSQMQCRANVAGDAIICDQVQDSSGDCAAGAVCLGGHTHSEYITATLTQEEVEDYAGAMVSSGTETRINVTYDDATGQFSFVVDDMNDDVPDAGDFGAATDLDANGALNTNSVSDNEIDYTTVTLADFTNDAGFSTGGITWGTPVNTSVTLDTDSSYDLGATATRFANGYFDTVYGNGKGTSFFHPTQSTGISIPYDNEMRFYASNTIFGAITSSGQKAFTLNSNGDNIDTIIETDTNTAAVTIDASAELMNITIPVEIQDNITTTDNSRVCNSGKTVCWKTYVDAGGNLITVKE